MKKLLAVVLFLFSGSAMAQDIYLSYNLPPGGGTSFVVAHTYPGCTPTVKSITSGHNDVAAWMPSLGNEVFSVRAINIGSSQAASGVIVRLGGC